MPSPAEYLGHVVGAAGELSRTSQIHGYLRALAAASERVDVTVIGRTEEAEKKEKENEDEESDAGELVISGGIKNGDSLQGHPAIRDIPVGTGRVIAFNFNPMHRDLNRSDHRFLWNAILNWQRILQPGPAKDE
ncbi:MAG: hypothetical protein L0Y45_00325 [Woeseiaceae bacterium]|nr:hypothetical protein [Woeseiaceae bacterium]